MATEKDLKIVISAVNTSQKQMKEVKTQLDDVAKSMAKTQTTSQDLTASVFKGTAAWDLTKDAIRMATNFLKSAMQESMDSARIMAQVQTNVKNAGFAFEEIAPKIEEFGKNAVQLGFDDEVAAESLSKLLIVTKDYSQAQSLASLAMDLSRAKNIDLASATKAVTLITQGNTKELKLQGIEIDETASAAENLQKVFENVKDSAGNFANTSAGQLAVLTEQWNNLKQKIGDELSPTLMDALDIVNQNQGTIMALADAFVFLGKGIGFVVKGYVGFGNVLGVGISAIAEKATEDISTVAWGLNKLGIVSEETLAKADANAKQWKDTTKAAADATLDLYDSVPKLTKSLGDYSAGLKGVKGSSKEATQAQKDLKDAVASANTEYNSFAKNVDSSLADLEDAHRNKMSSISESISDVKKQLKDLAKTYSTDLNNALESFNTSSSSNTKSLAEAVVANQTAIQELNDELAAGVTNERRTEIETELAGRLAAEQNNATLIASISSEIAAVKQFNSLTELEQAVFNFTQKQALAQKEYDDNVARIRSEYREKKKALDDNMADLKAANKEEEAIYEERRDFIIQTKKDALAIHVASAKSSISVTKAEVETEIKYYQALAEAVKAARSGGTSSFSNIKSTVASVKVPAFATGGIVTRPTLAMVGEAGPEAIIPLTGKNKAGGDVYISFTGNSFMGDDAMAEEVGNKIINVLKRSRQL